MMWYDYDYDYDYDMIWCDIYISTHLRGPMLCLFFFSWRATRFMSNKITLDQNANTGRSRKGQGCTPTRRPRGNKRHTMPNVGSTTPKAATYILCKQTTVSSQWSWACARPLLLGFFVQTSSVDVRIVGNEANMKCLHIVDSGQGGCGVFHKSYGHTCMACIYEWTSSTHDM